MVIANRISAGGAICSRAQGSVDCKNTPMTPQRLRQSRDEPKNESPRKNLKYLG